MIIDGMQIMLFVSNFIIFLLGIFPLKIIWVFIKENKKW